jgi:hypothetical protein
VHGFLSAMFPDYCSSILPCVISARYDMHCDKFVDAVQFSGQTVATNAMFPDYCSFILPCVISARYDMQCDKFLDAVQFSGHTVATDSIQ